MKVKFEKCKFVSELNYFYHSNGEYNLVYDPLCCTWESVDYVKSLKNILLERFPSIEFRFWHDDNAAFTFSEQSDEAAFLLWSSEGIEI